MGNDGGSVPRRIEIVKVRKQRKEENKAELTRCKWEMCALSKRKLTPPVVACPAGFLFNKDALLMAVLEKRLPSEFSHIKSLKDLIDVKLSYAVGAGEKESDSASFVCPVTQTPMKGTYQFSLMKDCGCVISNRALSEISDRTSCLNCGHVLINGEDSVLPLNGDRETVTALLVKHRAARKAEKQAKKAKKKEKKEKNRSILSSSDVESKTSHPDKSGDKTVAETTLSKKGGMKRKAEEKLGKIGPSMKKQRLEPSINSTLAASMAVKETAEQLMPKFANKDVYSSLFIKEDSASKEKDTPQLTTSNDAFCGRFLTHRPA